MTDDILYEYAMRFIGLPYKWGGQHPCEGYDCSGLCVELLQAQGKLRHGSDYTSKSLYKYLLTAGGDLIKDGTFGAISFYGKGWEADRSQVTHCGFCLNDEYMIEAGGGGKDTITKKVAVRRRAFVRLRPIKYRKDLVGIILP